MRAHFHRRQNGSGFGSAGGVISHPGSLPLSGASRVRSGSAGAGSDVVAAASAPGFPDAGWDGVTLCGRFQRLRVVDRFHTEHLHGHLFAIEIAHGVGTQDGDEAGEDDHLSGPAGRGSDHRNADPRAAQHARARPGAGGAPGIAGRPVRHRLFGKFVMRGAFLAAAAALLNLPRFRP